MRVATAVNERGCISQLGARSASAPRLSPDESDRVEPSQKPLNTAGLRWSPALAKKSDEHLEPDAARPAMHGPRGSDRPGGVIGADGNG